MAVIRPRLRLSANGAAVLVSGRDQWRVLAVPELHVRAEQPVRALREMSLSWSGGAVAALVDGGELQVLRGPGWLVHRLPGDETLGIAVSDDGARLARLAPGRVELWSLPPTDSPERVSEVPVDGRGSLHGDPELQLLAVVADGRPAAVVGEVAGWEVRDAPVQVLLGAGAAWGVFADGVRDLVSGRTLPGTLRDRLVYSPDGSLLLAVRGEEVLENGRTRVLMRVLETGGEEVRRVEVSVNDHPAAGYALTPAGDPVVLEVDDHGEVAVREAA